MSITLFPLLPLSNPIGKISQSDSNVTGEPKPKRGQASLETEQFPSVMLRGSSGVAGSSAIEATEATEDNTAGSQGLKTEALHLKLTCFVCGFLSVRKFLFIVATCRGAAEAALTGAGNRIGGTEAVLEPPRDRTTK
jgi:hypothetical protein